MLLRIGIVVWLGILSVEDLKEKSVMVSHLLIGGIGICAVALAFGVNSHTWSVASVCRSMIPGIFLLSTAFFTQKAGYADGLILLFLGIAIGRDKCLIVFLSSLLFTAVVSMVLLVLKKADRHTAIPYIPFVLMGWLIEGVLI